MSKFIKISLILSLGINLLFAEQNKNETVEEALRSLSKNKSPNSSIDKILNGKTGFKLENKEEENNNSTKSKSNNGKKVETPEEALKKLQKDGEKESNIDRILNGNTGFK
ncbi:hypothetical protein ACN5O4_03995 [Aliarcobacter butzleri]|uniref:hypothetical protein n=1 Tax=Aliarcobacter butzleri TaxID=28197 RepID=UPI00189E6E86|nr:hypothetical protein [Aliarcobacter butzleri]MBF7070597.1 hypothetical protein [Aliarcobacter butzleri]MCG3682846.1 hypothetical protein [Aliarcobacter butzleri]